jgi:hypothetical protein
MSSVEMQTRFLPTSQTTSTDPPRNRKQETGSHVQTTKTKSGEKSGAKEGKYGEQSSGVHEMVGEPQGAVAFV